MSGTHSSQEASHGASHANLTSYTVGFILSLILTAFSFGAVMSGLVPKDLVLPAITALAVVQLLVQLVFFLHLGTASEQINNTVIFIMSVLLIAIIVAGSLWVIHNANVNMMPTQMSPDQARFRN